MSWHEPYIALGFSAVWIIRRHLLVHDQQEQRQRDILTSKPGMAT